MKKDKHIGKAWRRSLLNHAKGSRIRMMIYIMEANRIESPEQ